VCDKGARNWRLKTGRGDDEDGQRKAETLNNSKLNECLFSDWLEKQALCTGPM